MQAPSGTIISIDQRIATVSVDRVLGCARCAAGKGCGAGLLNGNPKPARLTVDLPPDSLLQVGDTVTLFLEPQQILKAAMLVYGLPMGGLVLALLIAEWGAGPLDDLMAGLVAIAGLLGGLAVGRYRLRQENCLEHFIPRIASDSRQ